MVIGSQRWWVPRGGELPVLVGSQWWWDPGGGGLPVAGGVPLLVGSWWRWAPNSGELQAVVGSQCWWAPSSGWWAPRGLQPAGAVPQSPPSWPSQEPTPSQNPHPRPGLSLFKRQDEDPAWQGRAEQQPASPGRQEQAVLETPERGERWAQAGSSQLKSSACHRCCHKSAVQQLNLVLRGEERAVSPRHCPDTTRQDKQEVIRESRKSQGGGKR